MKAILFDIDGVVNGGQMLSLAKFGLDDAVMQSFFTTAFNDCLLGKADVKVLLRPYLQEWKFPGTIDDFIQHWHDSENATKEDMRQLINNLRVQGYCIAAATNQEQHRTKYLRTTMGYDRLFDHVYSSCELGYAKPDSSFFTAILDQLKLPANKVIFFDDTQKNVDAAALIGMHSYLFQSSDQCKSIIDQLKSKLNYTI